MTSEIPTPIIFAILSAFSSTLVAIRGKSEDVASTYQGGIDFLFLDADHEYTGVKTDWDSWSRHLVDEAIVVFHDVGWAEGVQKVIESDVSPIAIEEFRLPNMYWARVGVPSE